MTQFDDRYDPIYQRGHRIPAEGRPQDLSADPAGRTARYAGTPGKAGSAGADVGFAAAPAAPSTSSDLTGAADSAARCHQAGIAATIARSIVRR